VVERALLPTVAYLAGPGELAYFAQVSAVADALDAARPLAVPRWSGTIIEPHIARLLARVGAAPEELADSHALERRIARAAVPPRAAAALDAFRKQIAQLGGSIREAAGSAGAGLLPDAVIAGAERALLYRVERLERRLLAAVKRREEAARHDIATLRGNLFPAGKPQERALNLMPLLARHGPPLLERMRARAAEHAASLVESMPSRQTSGAGAGA
jgi:uncharacterized protein YllA (UPF0747 family)